MNKEINFSTLKNSNHFEDLWENAEKVAAELYGESSVGELINTIKSNLMLLRNDNIDTQGYLIGKILFDIAYLSQKINVNVYGALHEVVDDAKTDILENVSHVD